MIPKKRADQLIKKFYPEVQWKLGQDDCLDRAKRCALITVYEIITQWEYIDTYISDLDGELNPNLKYWYEVKQEIENS